MLEELSPVRAGDVMFGNLIDYAGLFPPASLSMASAVAEYREARSGVHRWMLGRFICTASRLEELAGVLIATSTASDEPWAISVILDGDVSRAAVNTRAFDAEMEPGAQVALLEAPLPVEVGDGRPPAAAAAAALATVKAALAASAVAMPFFEITRTAGSRDGIPNAVSALVALRRDVMRPLGSKLRCGGAQPDAFPEPDEVAAFIASCIRHGIPFKATAGLHHPIRHFDASLGAMRHGFMNLLIAAAIAVDGADEARLREIIEDTDPSSFAVSASGATWRNHSIRIPLLRQARERFASYGSCSFEEPTADLVELGLVAPT